MPEPNVSQVQTYGRPIESEFAKWLEQLHEELGLLEHDLKGEYLDTSDANKPVWRLSGEAVMSERGVRYLVGELRTVCNKNVFMSNLEQDTERIYDILVSYLNTITDNLLYNHTTYGLSAKHLDSVVEKCANFMEFALRRPLYAGERGFMKETQSVSRIESMNQPGVIQGVLGGIGSIFRGGRR